MNPAAVTVTLLHCARHFNHQLALHRQIERLQRQLVIKVPRTVEQRNGYGRRVHAASLLARVSVR
ncbi:hypothetical protein, partial [Pantoea sp. R102]|uniref:hypothetical protein n=1 Tax=Pantoea sp. R102 TaxID=2507583 RepID=UPI0014574907